MKVTFTATLLKCNQEKGGILLRSIIVVATLIIIGFTIYTFLRNIGQDQEVAHRKALAIAEYGLMVVLQQFQGDSTVISDIPKTHYDDGWYKVSVKKSYRNDTMFCTITAQGCVGSATEKRTCLLRLDISGTAPQWVREQMY